LLCIISHREFDRYPQGEKMKHPIFVSISSAFPTLALLMMIAVMTASCVSPTPPFTFTPPPSSTLPALQPEFVIADFDSCSGVTEQGGAMGAAYDPSSGDKLVESYIQEVERGCIARLEFDIAGWSAFWIKLQGADLSSYSQLVFDIKADPQEKVPGKVKIELKRAAGQEVSILYISGITTEWQMMSVNLRDFGPSYADPLSSFTDMEELVFTFEASQSGKTGVIYLDNIALR
jgi:hypothetical protein